MAALRTPTALLLALLASAALGAGPRCKALDGDSLQCGPERVRLFDVYAAEMSEPGGREARDNLRRIIAGGELRLVRHGQDKYGRTLADLYVNGRRVVQSDIGPRAGNGARSGNASRVYVRPAPKPPEKRGQTPISAPISAPAHGRAP